MDAKKLNELLKHTRDQRFRKQTQAVVDMANANKALAQTPEGQQRIREQQAKRKATGWSTKLIGNQNGKNSPRMQGKRHTAATKHLLSQAMTGRDHSSITGVPKPKATCPHCGKTGGRPQMIQFHFDKCKHK